MLNWYLRKERSRKELEKLLEQLNQSEHYLYEIDVQNDEDIINGFAQIGKDVGQIDGVFIQSHLPIWKIYEVDFQKHLAKVSYLHKKLVHIHLLVAHEAKNLCLKVEVLLRRLILVVGSSSKL